MNRPTDFAIALIALGIAGTGWLYADELRGRMRELGFDVTGQFVVARLLVMCAEDLPRFERRRRSCDDREYQYHATRFARTELGNKLPGLRGAA